MLSLFQGKKTCLLQLQDEPEGMKRLKGSSCLSIPTGWMHMQIDETKEN